MRRWRSGSAARALSGLPRLGADLPGGPGAGVDGRPLARPAAGGRSRDRLRGRAGACRLRRRRRRPSSSFWLAVIERRRPQTGIVYAVLATAGLYLVFAWGCGCGCPRAAVRVSAGWKPSSTSHRVSRWRSRRSTSSSAFLGCAARDDRRRPARASGRPRPFRCSCPSPTRSARRSPRSSCWPGSTTGPCTAGRRPPSCSTSRARPPRS
ncbi:MAG: hypothetical protein MZU95_04750 [Desulfomicrobium escambiense]|nr:hypothetical protein [Desulfomicrobium escambiense]